MRGIIVILIVAAMSAAAGIFWYASARSVPAEVIAAMEQGDVAGLAARVDFDALRAFLKEDLRAKKNDKSPIGSLTAGAGPSMDKIDSVVDYYVQPENIPIIYAMRDSAARDIPVEKFVVSRGYVAPYGFSLTFGAPPELLKDGARAIADRYRVTVVFTLSGGAWKITEMRVPLYMVPQFTYSQPAVDIYAPRRN